MTELPKLISELAAAPIRAQERMDAIWLEALRRWRSWQSVEPLPEGVALLREYPDLAAALHSPRPFLGQYAISVTLQFREERETTVRLMAEPLNGVWQSLFGAEAVAPKLGFESRQQNQESQETSISLSIVQVPVPDVAPAAIGQKL